VGKTIQHGIRSLGAKLSGSVAPVLLLILSTFPASADNLTEAKVKAAFLYNFTKFITWPVTSSGVRTEPFTICELGEKPLEGMIDETVRGKSVDDRPFRTRHVETKQDRLGCQVFFLPAGQRLSSSDIAQDAGLYGVLTVSESEDIDRPDRFTAMITFILKDGKVRFVINGKAAEKAGLTISSRLLTLALKVQ
jgi:hypothetical protein